MDSISQQMSDLDVRFEELIWIPGIAAAPPSDGAFEQFCENLPEHADDPLYQDLPFLQEFAGECPSTDEVGELLGMHEIFGFLIQLATPFITPIDKISHSSSWGHYHTRWVYVAGINQFVSVATAYSEEMQAYDRAKAEAA